LNSHDVPVLIVSLNQRKTTWAGTDIVVEHGLSLSEAISLMQLKVSSSIVKSPAKELVLNIKNVSTIPILFIKRIIANP
jgi:hypothetical protein